MAKIEFVGQSARDSSNPKANPSRLLNGYREPLVAGGKSQYVLRAVPGMELFATVEGIFVREMNVETVNLLAIGGKLYAVRPNLVGITFIGDIIDSELTSMAENNGIVALAAGGQYRTVTGGVTLSAPIATGAVPAVGSVGYLGGYTLVSERNGRKVQWSALVDPATFNGTHFASAEITQDAIIRLIVFKDTVYIFKASGFERWGLTGGSGPNAFARIDGAQMEPGLKAFRLITQFPNGFAYASSDGKIMAFVGGALTPISTPPIEVALAANEAAAMLYYEVRGHGFICVIFDDIPAWCYDIATGEWHERGQGVDCLDPWSAKAAGKIEDGWLVATDGGRLALLTVDECRDFGLPMVRRYVSRTLAQPGRVIINKIEAFPRVGLDNDGRAFPGSIEVGPPAFAPANVQLRTSRDGGYNWSPPRLRSVGAVGAYQTRLTWRALGQFREATIELSQSSIADVPLLAEIDLGAS